MPDRRGEQWLGLERVESDRWRLPVVEGLVSGASALFGGCATAAALVVSRPLTPHPIVWAAAHFGALAPLGSEVDLVTRVVSAGRTMTHVEVVGSFDGRESFHVRCAAGERPGGGTQGWWTAPVDAPRPADCVAFDHPVHAGTWAARYEWRLAVPRPAPAPVSAWWVRPTEDTDPLVDAATLVDYVTYGVGRALGVPMGGLSIDNVVRIRRLPEAGAWLLLEVAPEAVAEGFGFGRARLYDESGELLVAGSQSIVVNGWDWRLDDER